MRLSVGVCAPERGFDFEINLIVHDIFVELRKYAKAIGIEATFYLLSGYGGRLERLPETWNTICRQLDAIEAMKSPVSLLLITGQDWGEPIPAFIIPADHADEYAEKHLSQYYQLDTHSNAWHLKAEYKESFQEVLNALPSRTGLDTVAQHVLQKDTSKVYWVSREVEDADTLADDQIKQFRDILPTNVSGKLDLETLRKSEVFQKNLAAKFPKQNSKSFKVDVANANGVASAALDTYCGEFRQYVFRLLQRFITKIARESSIGRTADTFLHQDILSCRSNALSMREDLADKIIKFTNFSREMEGSPSASSFLVLHGKPCIGKSTLVAQAIQKSMTKAKGTSVVIRFIGNGCNTNSYTLRGLLHSLNEELSHIYRREAAALSTTVEKALEKAVQEIQQLERLAAEDPEACVADEEYQSLDLLRAQQTSLRHNFDTLGPASLQFCEKLKFASERRPLLLVFCGLDRLDESDIAEKLDWLPMELPKYVRILVTTDNGPVFDGLRGHILDPFCFVEVPNLDFVDNDSVFKQWNKEHPLTDSQSRCLLNIIQDANHPLYTQVLLASGATWRSFDSISKLKKQVPRSSGTPEDMLTKTVAVICKRYPSEDIVHRILAYITFFQREPLREAELLDILALDNSLLELVATHYAYNVGIGRMCDIIWCDIALRLHPFLVPLSKDKVCWCHDAIALAARKFYLEPILHQIASIAAEYVTGAYSNTTKPLQLRPATANILGIDCHVDLKRGVSDQPLIYKHPDITSSNPQPNRRFLSSAFEVLGCLGNWKAVLEQFLCNFFWLEEKLKLHGLMALVEAIRRLDRSQATNTVKVTLIDLCCTLESIANEVNGPVKLAKQLLLRLPVSTVPLQILRHQAELAIGCKEGGLWSMAPLVPIAELECQSVIRSPAWQCWWAGLGLVMASTRKSAVKATTGRLDLVLIWLNAASRDILRVYNIKTGILFFEKELEPIPKNVNEHDQQMEGGDAYGIAGVGIGDNMRGVAVWSNGQVRMWALPAGEELLEFRAQDNVTEIALCANGTTLVTANNDSYGIWNTQTGTLLYGEKGLQHISDVAVSDNGAMVAVAKAIGSVLLVNVQNKSSASIAIEGTSPIISVAIHDTSMVAVSLGNSTVVVVDIKTEKVVSNYRHPGQVEAVALSSNGWCASASGGEKADGRIHLHNIKTNEHKLLVGHASDINSVAFHSNLGECVVSAGHDGTVRLWQSNESRNSLPKQHLHDDAVDFIQSTEKFIVSATATYTQLHFWSPEGVWLHTTNLKVDDTGLDRRFYLTGRLATHYDGDWVVATLSDHSICCYSWYKDSVLSCQVKSAIEATFVGTSDPLPTVVVASEDSLVAIDVSAAKIIKTIKLNGGNVQQLAGNIHSSLCVCGFDNRFVVVDLDSGEIQRDISREIFGVDVPVFSLFSRGHVRSPWLLYYEQGAASVILHPLVSSADEELALEGNNISCAAVDNDGRKVALCSNDGAVVVWDIEAGGVLMQEHDAHSGVVEQCSFSKDDRWLITAAQDTVVKSWDANNSFRECSSEQCMSPVSTLCVSLRSNMVTVGLRNGIVGHLSLISASQTGKERVKLEYGESSLYNLMTTVERTTRSNAKAKEKPKRNESPSQSGSATSSAQNTTSRDKVALSAAGLNRQDSSNTKRCCCMQ